MTNKLNRTGFAYTSPGRPYQPGRPAYTSYETFTVVSAAPPTTSGSGLAPGWVYKQVPVKDAYGNVTLVWQPVWTGGGTSVGSGATSTTSPNGTVTTTYTVATVHPAVPEVPGVPPRRVAIPPLGWTSFAHSQAGSRGGVVTKFKVVKEANGVAVGLSPTVAPSVGYGHIRNGLLFSAGTVRMLSTGAVLDTYNTSDEFTVASRSTTVTYSKGGAPIGSEATRLTPGEFNYLAVAMYGAGDYVDEPSFTAAQEFASSTARLAPLTATSADAKRATSVARFARLKVTSGLLNRSVARFKPLTAFSADRSVASSTAAFGRMRATSYGGTVAVVPQNESSAQIGGLTAASMLLVGQTATSAATLKPLWALGADHAYAGSTAVFSRLRANSYNEPAGMAYLFDGVNFDVVFDARSSTAVDGRDKFTFDVPMSGQTIQNADGRDAFNIAIPMSGVGQHKADGRDTFYFDVPMGVPDSGTEVWAINIEYNGSTSYAGYDFNSFAKIGDRYYGAKSDGIHELDGETDNGKPINASWTPGKLNFGNSLRKTVQNCYMGIASTGTMKLKIEAEGGTYAYSVRSFDVNMQTQRFTMGKGLRTNYVSPTFYNVAGADFSIDATEFLVADLTRKI